MKTQRLLIALTLVNLALLFFALVWIRPALANVISPVLRARGLEIVDDQGRVRASIVIHPAKPDVTLPSGRTQPETVMLRLVDENGRPSVKLGASVHGAGLACGGETDATYAILKAEGPDSVLKLTNAEGKEQLVKP